MFLIIAAIVAKALGNVGVPFTRELLHHRSQSIIVLELSSYQIETLYQPCLGQALILNITPDHLDRYKTWRLTPAPNVRFQHV